MKLAAASSMNGSLSLTVSGSAAPRRLLSSSGVFGAVWDVLIIARLLGRDVQPPGEDKIRVPCRLRAMREDLPVDANRGVAEVGTHFLRPLGRHLPHLPKSVALQHVLIGQVVERQIFGLALDGQIPAPTKKARHPKELRDVLGVVPVVKLTLHFWSDIGPHRQ